MTPTSRYYKRRAHIGGDLPDWVAVLPNCSVAVSAPFTPWNERFYESHDALMRAVGIAPDAFHSDYELVEEPEELPRYCIVLAASDNSVIAELGQARCNFGATSEAFEFLRLDGIVQAGLKVRVLNVQTGHEVSSLNLIPGVMETIFEILPSVRELRPDLPKYFLLDNFSSVGVAITAPDSEVMELSLDSLLASHGLDFTDLRKVDFKDCHDLPVYEIVRVQREEPGLTSLGGRFRSILHAGWIAAGVMASLDREDLCLAVSRRGTDELDLFMPEMFEGWRFAFEPDGFRRIPLRHAGDA